MIPTSWKAACLYGAVLVVIFVAVWIGQNLYWGGE